MAMTNLPASMLPLFTFGYLSDGNTGNVNAVNARVFAVGYCYLQGQTGSKTISAAGGGQIYMNTSAGVVWANAGTSVDFGIQDVDASGLPDGTFDVSATLVPGTETFASTTLYAIPMEAGTKTISHGQLIAIGYLCTARAGTDNLTINQVFHPTFQMGLPYGVTGTGSTKGSQVAPFLIRFDDATWGWIDGAPLLYNTNQAESLQTFGSGSTPDEYAFVWEFPVPHRVTSWGTSLTNVATGDTFEAIAYTDPFGTPVAAVTMSPDPDQLVTGQTRFTLPTPLDCLANTPYAMALRPTTAGTISFLYQDLSSGFEVLKNAQPFSAIKMAARTDQTGPFVETQTYHLPFFLLSLAGFESGGSGVVGGAFTFVG